MTMHLTLPALLPTALEVSFLLKVFPGFATNSWDPGAPTNADAKHKPTVNFEEDLRVTIIRRALTHLALYPTCRGRILLPSSGLSSINTVPTGPFALEYDARGEEYIDVVRAGRADLLRVVTTVRVIEFQKPVTLLSEKGATIICRAPSHSRRMIAHNAAKNHPSSLVLFSLDTVPLDKDTMDRMGNVRTLLKQSSTRLKVVKLRWWMRLGCERVAYK